MSLLHLAGGGSSADDKLYPEDVFTSYLRTGTGADVTVNTGIDMTKGYILWTKGRSGETDHAIYDSARGVSKDLSSNLTAAETTQTTGLKSVSTTGHTIGSLAKMNTSGATYVDWVMRKAPKFFDIVTYTGNGVAGRQIPHNLGCEVGMIVTKATSATGNWNTYHRSATGDLKLNLTDAQTASRTIITSASTTTFTVSGVANTNGATYVAYLFTNDPSADGIIQCGGFTPSAGVDSVVSLGWEPQFLLVKSVAGGEYWRLLDVSRGMSLSGELDLYPNQSNSESTLTGERFVPTATGFYHKTGMVYQNGSAVIYLAIRRPNKVPTSGTEVYNAIARTGTGAAEEFNVGIVPDLVFVKNRPTSTSTYWAICDRLRAFSSATAGVLSSNATASEFYAIPSNAGVLLDGKTSKNVQYTSGSASTNITGIEAIHHFFKRAKGFMDIVCYTGTGVARTVNHNLGVVPELMIVKSRSGVSNWHVYNESVGNNKTMYLQLTNTPITSSYSYWNNTSPTTPSFTVGTNSEINGTASIYVAYLFATLAGISKVGSYIGNGTTQTINCGFTTGARFILIKRTDSTGDWYIWDTARGIVAANDPHLSLNTTSAEVTTDDSIDPESSGFIVNQVSATNINVTSASYIFLAIA